jgi:membrane-bound lytic murein transglycosylase B
MKMTKYLNILYFYFLINFYSIAFTEEQNFNEWLKSFKKLSMSNGISELTFNNTMQNVKFLPKVLEYDRFQPEFYEDTFTYISKRTGKQKIKKGINLYEKNKDFINSIDNEFNVEKELLLALMGIETNFGTYVGKMDIISSLATLSFDKRRSEFFTKELITILKLVDKGIIDYKILYGSWAGAFGNFQFMPSTIEKYAIDYDKNNIIELKTIDDSFASAANYINKMGWKKDQPCFYKVQLKKNIPNKFLNTSARKLKNKKKLKFFKKYILNSEEIESDENLIVAIITPDKDIIPNSNNLKPAFVVFSNYELILKWNRSLRFALATCKLKDDFFNEL